MAQPRIQPGALADNVSQGDNMDKPEDHECLVSPQASSTCYRQRSEEFRKLFKDLSESEQLIIDFACALQRDILLQGRLYLSENWLCFHSNVFWGTTLKVPLKSITAMSREKTALFIPNAIQICTEAEKLFFTSFSAREKSFQGIFKMWQNTLLDKPLGKAELWRMVRQHYGSDLGLSHEDMEYMLGPDSTPQSSRATKAGGEEHAGKRERPTSLRLPQVDSLSGSRKSPVGEEPQPTSSLPGGASMGTEGSRSPSSRHRLPDAPLDRNVLERGSKRLESPLERTAPDKGSKSPASPLERTTPDKWSKSPASPLERTTPDKWSKSPASPLDLNENEDRVTDGSSSESVDDADESVCPAPTQGRVYINRVFHTSAEKMFELLFMDSAFIQRFLEARKVTSVTNTPWQKDASGNMKRTLNYTITINNPLIGKFTTATESQTLYSDKHGGQHYLVDAEVYTHDVPYHDYFYTLNRFCISHSTKHKCHLRVYTDVKYKKQPWGFVKSFITKNSWSGLGDYFRHLEEELLEEEAELMQLSVENQATGVRRRRRPHGRLVPEHFNPNKQYGAEADPRLERIPGTRDRKGPQKWNISMMVAVMSSILLILTVLNMGLFLKLWAMEDVAQRMYLSTKQRLRERPESSVNPDVGSHQHLPDRSMEETQLLRSVLQDSIHLLEQLRSSLVLLQQSFQEPNVTARSR